MSTSTCAEVRGEIPLYVGGDLESPALERLEGHLGRCPACREVLSRANEARAALLDHLGDPAIEASRPTLWPGIRAGLVEEGLITPTGATGPRASEPIAAPTPRRGRLLRILPLVAAAAALFALSTLTSRNLGLAPGGDDPDEGLIDVAPPGEESVVRVEPGAVFPQSGGKQPEAAHPGVALTPVDADGQSLQNEASLWLGEVIPLSRPGPGSSNRIVSQPHSTPTRRDGVR